MRASEVATGQGEGVELSFVVPCLNEAATLPEVVRKALGAFDALGVAGEVVVADNGSTDGSQALARECGARVVDVAERGYGSAVRGGMRAARGRWLVMVDADDTYDPGELGPFLEGLRRGAEVVMGTRLGPGRMLPGANPLLNRFLGTPVLTFVLNRLFGTSIRDVNCGMRALTREAFDRIDLRATGMEFASEMLIKSALHRLRIAEVPVTLHPDRRGRRPHLRRWRDGWRHLEFMLVHAPDQLLFWPGLAAVALGLMLALPVSLGPAQVAGRTFDYHFLFLGGSLCLIGMQGVLGTILIRDADRGPLLRPSRLAAAVTRWLTLGRGLGLAVSLFLAGLAFDLAILVEWLGSHLGPLHEPRRAILGLLLMSVAAELGLFSFLHAVVRPRSRGALG